MVSSSVASAMLPYRCDTLAVAVPDGHPLALRDSCSFSETLDCEHVGLPAMLPDLLGWQGAAAWGTRLAALLAGGSFVLWRFQQRCVAGLEQASGFAADIASCQLGTNMQRDSSEQHSEQMGAP